MLNALAPSSTGSANEKVYEAMITTTEFRTPDETALQLELLLLGTLTSRELPEGPIVATPVTDALLQRELRRLADRVHALVAQGEGSIGVIGAVPAARRALVASWIAASVAPRRGVILVDADLRSAQLSFDEGSYAQEGLVDVLRYGVRSPRVIAPTQIPRVSLLPVGSGTVDLAGTWASDAVEPLLRDLARSGDFLVINGPGIEDLDDAGPFLDRISRWMLLHEIGASDTEATRAIRDRIGADRLVGVLVFNPLSAVAEAPAPEESREVLKARSPETFEEELVPNRKRRGFAGLLVVAGAAAIAAALLIPRLFSERSSESASETALVEEPWTAEEVVPPPVEEASDGIVEPLENKPILTRSTAGEAKPLGTTQGPAPLTASPQGSPTPAGTTQPSASATQPGASATEPSASATQPGASATEPPSSGAQVRTESAAPPTAAPRSIPPAGPAKPVQKSTSSASYGVHVCSMQTEAKAKEEAARFEASGYAAIVRRVDLGEKGIWHRVYAGPFEDRVAADRASEEIRARGLANFTLVHRIPEKQAASGS
jgi:cell division septation protein DedD/Mrp family chromosome partitioning ATPase